MKFVDGKCNEIDASLNFLNHFSYRSASDGLIRILRENEQKNKTKIT